MLSMGRFYDEGQEEMTDKPIIVGGLYRLPSDYCGWCKHGIATIIERDGILCAYDTYWGGSGRSVYKVSDIKGKLKFLIDMNHAEKVDKELYYQYEEKDRAYIPVGGGSAQYLVDKRAEPSLQLQIDQLYGKIESEERGIKSALWSIRLLERDLTRLRDKRDADIPLREHDHPIPHGGV